MSRLRVCIDATALSGEGSGVERYTLALSKALLTIQCDADSFSFLVRSDSTEFVRAELGSKAPLLLSAVPRASTRVAWLRKAMPQAFATAKNVIERHRRWAFAPVRSTGLIENCGMDLIHFPTQGAFLTEIPSVYQPHDLQHRHFPQYFTRKTLAYRESVYPVYCEQAAAVVVVSSWMKDDIVRAFGLPPEKVIVIPYAAPPTTSNERALADAAEVVVRHNLPDEFLFYPAQTYPHKNHLRLLEALATLKKEGLEIPLVLCGAPGESARAVDTRVEELNLRTQVWSLGCVEGRVLDLLWAKAKAAIVPSEFEAASFPVWEAFANEVPLACSNVTALPRQVGAAAILFSPTNVFEMAAAIRSIWADASLRHALKERGKTQIEGLSWPRTARTFRAAYRRICGRPLTEEDRTLIDESPRL